MAAMLVVVCHCLLFFSKIQVSSSATHWIVTEDGRLQAQMDSIFSMRRPYDLVALLKQEERASMLDSLKQELLSRKEDIDKNEDKDTGLEQRFYKSDPDCVAAGKPLPEFDLHISTVLPLENKGIRAEDHIDFKAEPSTSPVAPYCTELVKLDFSIHAFEHLEGMKERQNLTGNAELGLKNAITHRENVDDYGHLVYQALVKNATSWVLYNMAAFYWRIKGDPYNVIECLRRALHYSPRHQKDVALISLANVLHRARYSNEAAIVVHSALEISKELNVNHFTLGNIYAVLAEYNKSIICFENTLKIQPDFEAAAQRKHAVLCHAKLEAALEAQHKSLQRTLDELKGYQKKHKHWQEQSNILVTEQAPTEVKINQRIAYESQKIRELEFGSREVCTLIERDGRQILQCGSPSRPTPKLEFNFENRNKSEPQQKQSRKYQPRNTKRDYTKPVRPPLYKSNEETRKGKRGKKGKDVPQHKRKNWPSKEECDAYVQKFPSWDEFPTVYLPPENKGFEVSLLLTEAIDIDRYGEHDLPWYPPVCVTIVDMKDGEAYGDDLQSVKDRTKVPLKSDKTVKDILLQQVKDRPDITEEEIGQRILTGLKRNLGPRWIMYNLAGLYWRVIGNLYHGIECMRRALKFVPYDYFDVPLVNMANIMYHWGKMDDAIKLMRDAVRVNDAEPITHFFMANLLAGNNNLTGAVWHYERALHQDPDYNEAFTMLRTTRCYLKYHRAAQSEAPVSPAQPSCQTLPEVGGHEMHSETRMLCKKEADGMETCVVESRTRQINQCINSCQQQIESQGSCGPPRLDAVTVIKLDVDEDMKDYYRRQGLCKGKECDQIHTISSKDKNRPHIKLEFINGLWTQRLLFADKITDIQFGDSDCIFFNDGSRTPACDKEEYKPFLDNPFDHVRWDAIPWEWIIKYMSKGVQEAFRQHISETRQEYGPEMPVSREYRLILPNPNPMMDSAKRLKKVASNKSKKSNPTVKQPTIVSNKNININKKKSKNKKNNENLKSSQNIAPPCQQKNCGAEILDDPDLPEIEDSELPDTSVHIKQRLSLAPPTLDECEATKPVDFSAFSSTWLDMSSKGINLSDHVNFDDEIRGELKDPECQAEFGASAQSLDFLKSIADRDHLAYAGESGLRDVLRTLGGVSQPVEVIGARIGRALERQPHSWVLGVLAALYWRVEGDASRSINCLRASLHTAPPEMKDIPLLSMSNILYRAGRYNDAIVVTNMALETSPSIVLIHITMANIYAAKGDWERAALFYESTLGLQASFVIAKDKLRVIQCHSLFSGKSRLVDGLILSSPPLE